MSSHYSVSNIHTVSIKSIRTVINFSKNIIEQPLINEILTNKNMYMFLQVCRKVHKNNMRYLHTLRKY